MDDRISQLPDKILCLIVRRLSVIEAVRTSILSRKWKNLYKFIPDVTFDAHSLETFIPGVHPPSFELEKIAEGVYAFLRHYSSPKMVSFRLSFSSTRANINIPKKWMRSLSKLRLEKLELMVCHDTGPGPLFSWYLLFEAKSLNFVGLHGLSLQPQLMSLKNKSIKIIELHRNTLASGAIEFILSCCPSLESLTISNCVHPQQLCIHSPILKFLRIELCFQSHLIDIKLHASNLKTFEYIDCKMRIFTSFFVPLLESLSISLNGNIVQNVMPHVLGQLSRYHLPQVKSLFFQTCGSYYQEYEIFQLNNAILGNLRELHLMLTKPECDLLRITTIFNVCPLLQKFHLVAMESTLFNGQQVEMSVGFHSELEEVEFSGFSGTENEICFALYILKSAATLKRMRIIRCPKYYLGQEHGKWNWVKDKETRFSEEKLRVIRERLQGQALSDSAQVIILG